MIDPKLNSLLKVSELKNYSRAARELSLSQPAVSQHIKLLEQDLGARLFNRSRNCVKLTSEGEIAVKYAKRICTLYQNMEQAIRDEQQRTTHYTIGLTHTSESNIVTEVLANYCIENDGVHITILTDTIKNLYSMLKTYDIDLAIIEGEVPNGNFNSLLLDTDSLVLAVSPGSRLAKKGMVTIDELKKEKLILRLPNSGTRNLFVAHLESQNMSIDEFNVLLEVDNIATIKDLIRRNFGVSILPKSACMDELRKGKMVLLPVENLNMIRKTNIVYPKDFENGGILQSIVRVYNDMKNKGL